MITGPSSVMATVSSKCAEHFPSLVTTVHSSSRVLVSREPRLNIGSMAITRPLFRTRSLFNNESLT